MQTCDHGPPWCEQYRRLTAERDEALAANGDLANLIGKRDAEVARLKEWQDQYMVEHKRADDAEMENAKLQAVLA